MNLTCRYLRLSSFFFFNKKLEMFIYLYIHTQMYTPADVISVCRRDKWKSSDCDPLKLLSYQSAGIAFSPAVSNKSRDSRFISPRSLCDLAPEQVVVLSPITLGTPVPMEHVATAEQCVLVPVTGFPEDFKMAKTLRKFISLQGKRFCCKKGSKKEAERWKSILLKAFGEVFHTCAKCL